MLLLALWSGVLAGWIQLLGLAVRRWGLGEFLFVGPDVWWTTPATTIAMFLILAGGASILARWLDLLVWPTLVTGYSLLGIFSFLYLFPQIHRIAAIVLAAGASVQIGRAVARRPIALARLTRRTTPLLLLMVFMTALATRGALWRHERRADQALGAISEAAPNILLIILDTVRAMNLSLFGYGRPTSPNLTAIASEGTVFSQAYSTSPWTLPSHASMFTGRYVHDMSADWLVALNDRWPTLAEVLGQAGYRSVGISANTDYASREVGLGRGFVHFEDYPLTLPHILRSTPMTRMVARNRTLRRALGLDGGFGRRLAPVITDRLVRWLDRHDERPYFAFLNYYDAHRPYWPPEEYRQRFVPDGEGYDSRPNRRAEPGDDTLPEKTDWAINAYDGSLAYLDDQIRILLQTMEESGLLDNTLVIITSDHGEEFGEHGVFDHGNSFYRQAVHVPLIIRFPGHVPAGSRIDTPVSLAALPATIMELIGLEKHPFPGHSLAPLWQSPGRPGPQSPVVSEVRKVVRQPEWYPASQGNLAAIVKGPWRYIRNLETGVEELYDYRLDAVEARDLAGDTAAASSLMALREALARTRNPSRLAARKPPPAVIEDLRSGVRAEVHNALPETVPNVMLPRQ